MVQPGILIIEAPGNFASSQAIYLNLISKYRSWAISENFFELSGCCQIEFMPAFEIF